MTSRAVARRPSNRRFGFVAGLGDDHALARGEAVGLDDDRQRELLERVRAAAEFDPDVSGGRNAVSRRTDPW